MVLSLKVSLFDDCFEMDLYKIILPKKFTFFSAYFDTRNFLESKFRVFIYLWTFHLSVCISGLLQKS